MSIGDPVSHCDHIEAIVECVTEEYNALGAIIHYHTEICDILDAESPCFFHMNVAQTLQLIWKLGLEPISINVAQTLQPVLSSPLP